MFRSEQFSSYHINDIYYYSNPNQHSDRTFDNELVIHAFADSIYTDKQSHFYVGISSRDEMGNRWVNIPIDEIDNIITALLYAKHLAEHPEARRERT